MEGSSSAGAFPPSAHFSVADMTVMAVYFILNPAVGIWTDLYSSALFVQVCLGWNLYLSAVLMLAVTAVYTIAALNKIGGYPNLEEAYLNAAPSTIIPNTTCHLPRPDALHLFQEASSDDLPWTGMTFGLAILAMWYWCTDQVIVQRSLSARDLNHAKAASILASYLKMLPLIVIIVPRMISRILYPDAVSCVDPNECARVCGATVGCSNIAYPKLVIELMPSGCLGGDSTFAMGDWASNHRLVTVALVVVSVVWIPILQGSNSGQLHIYIQSVTSYLAPPVTAVFLLAVFWKRANEQNTVSSMAF